MYPSFEGFFIVPIPSIFTSLNIQKATALKADFKIQCPIKEPVFDRIL